ncbi:MULTISPECIES: peptidase [Gilliamella]|uniref:Peptidase n=1 Tax=Gilliamella apicola TaxID=1196095 RepID=A0A556SAZ5_9GAMM|nr:MULTISPECIES: peptidase [Gilliamella]MBI0095502.1 peptidase [Gilliamella sp. W8136]TSJ98320.1 peptidase [Gilliamella apicola]
MALIPVFKPGTHTAVDGRRITFTLENCVDLAESYDPSLSEAPAVIGHPKLTAPAYAWAKSFEVKDGLVYAKLDQINPEFAEAYNAGSYKKRSLSIYLPDSPGNPKPGHYYARHIGFLGAAAPAIKGLPDASFAESKGELGAAEFSMADEEFDENLISILSNLRDLLIEEIGIASADLFLPQWRIESLRAISDRKQKEKEMPQPNLDASFAEQQAAIDAKNADLAAREQVLFKKEQKQKRDEFISFADELIIAGKLLPTHKTSVVEVLMSLGNEPISFAEGDTTVNASSADLIKKVLSERPAFMNFSEKSAANDEGEIDTQDPKAIAEAAAAYQKEQADKGNAISISQAVAHVTKEKKQ